MPTAFPSLAFANAHVSVLFFSLGLSTQTENIYRIAMEIVVNVRASVIRGSVKGPGPSEMDIV